MKIGVIANCQAAPIARAIELVSSASTVLSLPVHLRGTAVFDKAHAEMSSLLSDPAAVVFSFPLGEAQAELHTAMLRKRARARVITLTNIHFGGLHPDATYVGELDGRVASPLGDYHSRIAVAAFLAGLGSDACEALYSDETYERAGYFYEFEKAANELRARDRLVDVKLAEEFLGFVIARPSLYTLNHPVPWVFQWIAEKLCGFIGLESRGVPDEMLPNYLSGGAWWPIDDCIARFHKLGYQGCDRYRQPEARGGAFLTRQQFVRRCYGLYSERRAALAQSRQAKDALKRFKDVGLL